MCMKKYIYGAGHNCESCIKLVRKCNDEILGIIDRNPNKWNLEIGNISVCPPDFLNRHEYGSVVVSLNSYVEVVDVLLSMGIGTELIEIYEAKADRIIPLQEMYSRYKEESAYQKSAVRQIKTGLLSEVKETGELINRGVISVFGTDEDYEIVRTFLNAAHLNDLKIVKNQIAVYPEEYQYLICGADYKDIVTEFRKNGNEQQKQWIILPFFDVKNSFIWK